MNSFTGLNAATISDGVKKQHPEYVALLLVAEGIQGGVSDSRSETLLLEAEASAATLLMALPLEEIPEVVAWREKFLSFGVKPRNAKSSVESLLKRSASGLPRVDLLTDLYNAVSIINLVPIGGEDLDTYVGAPQLVVAVGTEHFDARENGEIVNAPPEQGEIIWRDNHGATCRRWNWRQCVRTRLREETTNALFIFDGIGEEATERVELAAAQLTQYLKLWWPEVKITSRTLRS